MCFMSYCLVCSLQPCGQLTSWLTCIDAFMCFCHFPIWCLGSGVLFDWIPDLCLFLYFDVSCYLSASSNKHEISSFISGACIVFSTLFGLNWTDGH